MSRRVQGGHVAAGVLSHAAIAPVRRWLCVT
jgi:hypothetical protein